MPTITIHTDSNIIYDISQNHSSFQVLSHVIPCNIIMVSTLYAVQIY